MNKTSRELSPLVSISSGLIAGAIGSASQTLFFQISSAIKPAKPKNAFNPPEEKQKSEQETETVARRIVENFSQHGPIKNDQKKTLGVFVHFAFGAAWGAVFGLAAESFPEPVLSVTGASVFGGAVWMLSDNVLLPAVKLAGTPQKYPAKNHAYALAAHLVYGLSVWAAYEGCRRLFTTKITSPHSPSSLLLDDQFQLAS
jgi:uncharacterized membrane protein YagU involved in acid resistance